MKGLSKPLQAFDAHLREKNERDLRRQRSKEPPIGEGTNLRDCVECGRSFRSKSAFDSLCPKCLGDEIATHNESYEGEGRSYNYQPIRRGGRRD